MSDWSDFLLTYLINYGPPMLAVTVFVAAFGIPLPTTLLVIAAGAFVQQDILDALPAFLAGVIGAVGGDSLGYITGRIARVWVLDRFGGTTRWQSANLKFAKWGGWAVFFTRFLFTAFAPPTNLLAGTSGFLYWRFLIYDLLGEAVWIVGFGLLGYVFGEQWEQVSTAVSDSSGLFAGIAILGTGVFLLRRYAKTPVRRGAIPELIKQ